jgi:two-component system response regulator YesN
MTEGVSDELIAAWLADSNLVKDVLKQGIAYQLLFGHLGDQDELLRLLAIAQVAVVPTLAMALRAADGAAPPRRDPAERQLRVLRRLESLLQSEQEALATIMGRNNMLATVAGTQDVALLLPVNAAIFPSDVRPVAHRYARYVKAYLERGLDFSVAVGVGSVYRDFRQLRQSFAEARKAVSYCFYESNGTIVHSGDIEKFRLQENQTVFIRSETTLQDSLRRGDWDTFYRTCHELMDEIARGVMEPYVLKVRILEMLTLLSRTVIDMGGDSARLLDVKVRLGAEIEGIATNRQLRGWLDDVFRDLSWFAQENQRDFVAKAVVKVKQYLHANYTKNITLEELARHVLLSPSYLSHAFSESCGVSITEYLKAIRVKKAEAMLRSSNKSVTEVGASVGYLDPNYFARVFKRITGKSPQQYRKGG